MHPKHSAARSHNVTIAPYTGTSVRLEPDSVVRIVDVQGQQIADTWAFSAEDTSEFLCTSNTRVANQRIFPKAGDTFMSNRLKPMMQFLTDTSPGAHDMLCTACNDDIYRAMLGDNDHPSCAQNFRTVCESLRLSAPHTPPPSVNFFQNTPVDQHGSMSVHPATSRPGDYVELRALMPLILVVTACSFDLGEPGTPLRMNGDHCTPIRLECS